MTMMTTMMSMRTTVMWNTNLMTELEAILRFMALSTMPTKKGVQYTMDDGIPEDIDVIPEEEEGEV